MSWRIVSVSSPSKLDYKMGYLVVRSRDTASRIHLSEISVLILESTAISLTAYLLRELDRQKIDIVFCDETRTPYGILSILILHPNDFWERYSKLPFGPRRIMPIRFMSFLNESMILPLP